MGTVRICLTDCGSSVCGDGSCCVRAGENGCSCVADCGAGSCGDGFCCGGAGENECSCMADCGPTSCGDGLCCTAQGEEASTTQPLIKPPVNMWLEEWKDGVKLNKYEIAEGFWTFNAIGLSSGDPIQGSFTVSITVTGNSLKLKGVLAV
ncbi:hypothetical protein ACFL6C_09865 [Myxococcota bacterium]